MMSAYLTEKASGSADAWKNRCMFASSNPRSRWTKTMGAMSSPTSGILYYVRRQLHLCARGLPRHQCSWHQPGWLGGTGGGQAFRNSGGLCMHQTTASRCVLQVSSLPDEVCRGVDERLASKSFAFLEWTKKNSFKVHTSTSRMKLFNVNG